MTGVPVACGALGAYEPEAVDRMRAVLGPGLAEVHRDQSSLLLLDRDPVSWQSERGFALAWCERLPLQAGKAHSLAEAAATGACGLLIEGDRRVVHASASGVGPLYWRRAGGATYFATAIDPLTRVGEESLEADWESWAQIIALGYSCGDGTPFSAIKRLNPLGTLEHASGAEPRVDRGRLAWAEVEPTEAGDVAEQIVSALADELHALDPRAPLAALLSGGLDSRLMLALLANRGLELTAWTADTEEGQSQHEMAAAVAAALGVPHASVEPVDGPFADELGDAARSVEYESMLHLPMARLARSLPNDAVAVVNGLGGDTFVKGLVLTPEVIEAPDWRRSVGIVFDRFAPTRAAPFEPGAWQAIRGVAEQAFMGEAQRFADHPSAATLTYYWTRTRRGISQAAMRHFGASRQIVAPLVSDGVVRAALRAPQRAKLDSALYWRVLDLVNAEVARLPSTEAERHAPPGRQRRSERSPAARAAYLPLLERSPLRPWFSESLRSGLERGGLGGELRSHFGLRRVQAICTLGLWLDRYRDLLTDPDPAALIEG
jgi:Asparagine synthase